MTIHEMRFCPDPYPEEDWDFLDSRECSFSHGQLVRFKGSYSLKGIYIFVGPQKTNHVPVVVLCPLGKEFHPSNFMFWVTESQLELATEP